MNSYELSRNFFDWCFENPEKINPNHTAIYFFAIEHCNRLGWRDKFGFPTQMAMDALGIKKHQTYIKYFNDLVEWKFFKLIEKSKNQYSSNIISLIFAIPKNGKALDKAIINHTAKQTESSGQSTGQSNSSIDKQITINNNTLLSEIKISDDENFLIYNDEKFERTKSEIKYFEIANVFRKTFIENLKKKGAPFKIQEKATFKNYVDPIRLMLENKECTIDDLRDVETYLSGVHSEFWKKNILSTVKLRKQIQQLIMEARKPIVKPKPQERL